MDSSADLLATLRASNLGDEFWMYHFKVLPCPHGYRHSWTACPFSHGSETARRRCPKVHTYCPELCPNAKAKRPCHVGDACPYAHNTFEQWLHPHRYRTRLCYLGAQCQRSTCFFAHTVEELRHCEIDEREAAAQALASSQVSLSTISPELAGLPAALLAPPPALSSNGGALSGSLNISAISAALAPSLHALQASRPDLLGPGEIISAPLPSLHAGQGGNGQGPARPQSPVSAGPVPSSISATPGSSALAKHPAMQALRACMKPPPIIKPGMQPAMGNMPGGVNHAAMAMMDALLYQQHQHQHQQQQAGPAGPRHHQQHPTSMPSIGAQTVSGNGNTVGSMWQGLQPSQEAADGAQSGPLPRLRTDKSSASEPLPCLHPASGAPGLAAYHLASASSTNQGGLYVIGGEDDEIGTPRRGPSATVGGTGGGGGGLVGLDHHMGHALHGLRIGPQSNDSSCSGPNSQQHLRMGSLLLQHSPAAAQQQHHHHMNCQQQQQQQQQQRHGGSSKTGGSMGMHSGSMHMGRLSPAEPATGAYNPGPGHLGARSNHVIMGRVSANGGTAGMAGGFADGSSGAWRVSQPALPPWQAPPAAAASSAGANAHVTHMAASSPPASPSLPRTSAAAAGGSASSAAACSGSPAASGVTSAPAGAVMLQEGELEALLPLLQGLLSQSLANGQLTLVEGQLHLTSKLKGDASSAAGTAANGSSAAVGANGNVSASAAATGKGETA